MLMVEHFVLSTLSWVTGLMYIRMKRAGILFDAFLMGFLCGIAAFALQKLGLTDYLALAELTLFLLMMLAVQLQRRENYRDAVFAFLLAQSEMAMLRTAVDCPLDGFASAQAVMAFLFAAIYLVLTLALRKRFPATDWRESFTKTPVQPGRLPLEKWHFYLIPAALCTIFTATSFLLQLTDFTALLLWEILSAMLFWAGMLLLIFINAYKREWVAVLAEQQYRGEMKSFLDVIRSQRHDYNFHVQTISGLIRAGNWAECEKYVDELEQDATVMNEVLPLKDPAISAMIHNFRLRAAQEKIKLHIDIQNDLSMIATNVYETNKIISNLLQNAIDETKQHADKSYGIHLTILKRGEFCVIHTSNEMGTTEVSAEEIGRIYQQGYTTKPGHDGVGLSSVRSLLARYHGVIYTYTEENVIHFVAKVPINYIKMEK